MLETIITNLVVLFAALYLARWVYKNLVSKKDGPACSSCETCDSSESNEGAASPARRA